jgi:FkbM family methyltransferase
VRTLLGRIVKPFVLEGKRQLCWRGLGAPIFPVSVFGPFRFQCGSKTEYHRTVGFGGEASALGAFLFLLREDDVVWDVGASVGLYAVHAAGTVRSVVAFEPDPATFQRLVANVRLNGFADRVICRARALGRSPGVVQLHTDGLEGNAPSVRNLERHTGSETVTLETVDTVLAEGVIAPTVLKLDVEGAELAVLEGATRMLASERRPRVLFAEVHRKFLPNGGDDVGRIEALIAKAGYQVLGRQARADESHLIAVR